MKLIEKVILTLAVCFIIGSAVTAAAYIMEPPPVYYPYDYTMPYMGMPYAPYPIEHIPYPYPYAYPHSYAIPHPGFTVVDFDVNSVADERLIKTFLLSPGDQNYLEIRFRAAYNLYRQGKYQEALEVFSDESLFWGNHLFLYWAGMCAVRLGDNSRATEFFNKVLAINPYYEPAIREVTLGR